MGIGGRNCPFVTYANQAQIRKAACFGSICTDWLPIFPDMYRFRLVRTSETVQISPKHATRCVLARFAQSREAGRSARIGSGGSGSAENQKRRKLPRAATTVSETQEIAEGGNLPPPKRKKSRRAERAMRRGSHLRGLRVGLPQNGRLTPRVLSG